MELQTKKQEKPQQKEELLVKLAMLQAQQRAILSVQERIHSSSTHNGEEVKESSSPSNEDANSQLRNGAATNQLSQDVKKLEVRNHVDEKSELIQNGRIHTSSAQPEEEEMY